MDWKKEYRVSDLLRRGGKPDGGASVEAPGPAEPPTWAAFADVAPAAPKLPADPAVWASFADVPPAESPAVPAAVEPPPAAAAAAEQLAAEPEPPAPEPSVWKKEFHLFGKRGGKVVERVEASAPAVVEPVEVPSAAPVASAVPAPEPSVWKKEFHLFGKRGEKVAGVAASEPVLAEPPAPEPEIAEEPEPVETIPGSARAEAAEPLADQWLEPASDVLDPVDEEPAPAVHELPEDAPADTTEPAAELEPAAEPEPAPASVWKKEIRVSDLFRRGEKQAKRAKTAEAPVAPEPDPTVAPAAPSPAPTSVWKKEIRIGGKRRASPPKSGQERRGPKRRQEQSRRDRPTESGSSGGRTGRGSSALPDVPLARAINLLPRDEEKSGERRLSLPGVAVSLVGLLVVGGLSFLVIYERARLTERQGDVEDLEAQAAAIDTPADATAPEQGVELAGEALQRIGALTSALDGRVVWDRLLRELSLTLPEGVWFETLVASVPGATVDPATGLTQQASGTQSLTATGYAMGQDGVAQLLARLAVIPQIASVQLQSSSVVELGEEEVVQFSIIATLRGPEGAVA